jgi:small conductance mechanosensitive channel
MNGLSELIKNLLDTVLSGVLLDVVSVSVSIAALVLGAILVIKLANRLLRSLLKIKKHDKQTVTVSKLLNSVINFFVWFIVLSIALAEIGIDIAPLLASAGVLGFAIGFGAQETIKDFLGGIFLILDNTMYIGDVVEIDGFKGTVKDLRLRTTSIENWMGQLKTINNGAIKTIVNFSKANSLAIVDFEVDYETDLKKLNEVMPEFLKKIEQKNENITETPQFLGVMALGNNGISLRIIAKTKSNEQYGVERMIRQELVEVLNQNNVVIPFPQMVIRNAQ